MKYIIGWKNSLKNLEDFSDCFLAEREGFEPSVGY